MLRLSLASVAVGLLVSHACAQSLKPKENGDDYLGSAQTFSCEPFWQSDNPIVASDPTFKAIVSIKFKENGDASAIKVVHVAESGEKYDRAVQYIQWHLVTTPGYRDYNWYGTGVKDHNILMHGKLFENDSARHGKNRWFYTEEQFTHGLKTSENQTLCNKTG
jgi:hypothetical protein